MGSLNKVTLIGYLGKDPDVRATASGIKVANLSLATEESYTDKSTNLKTNKTEWHKIIMWRGLAEVAERYLRKGMQVCIEGKLSTRSWDDKDGVKHYTTEIVADNLIILGKGSRDSDDGFMPDSTKSGVVTKRATFVDVGKRKPPSADEDDLPF